MRKPINFNKKNMQRIISLVAAIIIWIFITYTENPQIDITLKTIPVQFTGESLLYSRDLMVINKKSVPDASIVLRGKRRDLINVLNNISATLDITNISSKGTYRITPEFDIPSNAVYISKRITNRIDVNIADISEKTINVKVVQKNSDKNKSFIVESIPEITSVEIKGYIDDIEKIEYATIYIDVATMLSDNLTSYPVVFENKDGASVTTENTLYCDIAEIEVANEVYDKVELPVNLEIPSLVGKKYTVNLLKQSVDKVYAGIKSEKGKKITSLTNIDDFSGITDETTEYTLKLDVPDSLYVPKESQEIKVSVEVFERVEKTLAIPVTVQNADGFTYNLSSQYVYVNVSGPDEKLVENNLSAILDFKNNNITDGTHRYKVVITTKDDDITVISDSLYIEATIN